MISRDKCFELIKNENSNSKQMSQFQNDALQFDFVKCLVQTRKPSVGMVTDLSFHTQIVTYSRKFYFVKINFNCLFSSYPYFKKSL